ncbi:hypothetical protein [Lichenibacterium dinghuense]|uniref:hypothetical protein n=1 Tax=Lichenibacterium dinghuense TaxID=2895977 RepID=UPI001F169809|nr:hypothetical protein [Lichenibacterium sp. 6Y81]
MSDGTIRVGAAAPRTIRRAADGDVVEPSVGRTEPRPRARREVPPPQREVPRPQVAAHPRRRAAAFVTTVTALFDGDSRALALAARRREGQARAAQRRRAAFASKPPLPDGTHTRASFPRSFVEERGRAAAERIGTDAVAGASAIPSGAGRPIGRPDAADPVQFDQWRSLGEVAAPMWSPSRRAEMVAAVLANGPAADDPAVVHMRGTITRPMMIAEAVLASGLGDDGLPAVVRLIADGLVRMRDGWSVAPERTVEPTPVEDGDGV